jgi:hypothetical protein
VPDKEKEFNPRLRLNPGMLGAVKNPQVPPEGKVAVALPEYPLPTWPEGKLEDQLGGAGGGAAVVLMFTERVPSSSKVLERRIVITKV